MPLTLTLTLHPDVVFGCNASPGVMPSRRPPVWAPAPPPAGTSRRNAGGHGPSASEGVVRVGEVAEGWDPSVGARCHRPSSSDRSEGARRARSDQRGLRSRAPPEAGFALPQLPLPQRARATRSDVGPRVQAIARSSERWDISRYESLARSAVPRDRLASPWNIL